MPGRLQLILPPGSDKPLEPVLLGGVRIAQSLGAALTVSVGRTQRSAAAHWLVEEYVYSRASDFDADSIAETEQLKACALAAAEKAGVAATALEIFNGVLGRERSIIMAARTHDFSILGQVDHAIETRRLAEELLFDGGRPLLLLPVSRPFHVHLDKIALAWDHSEPASRVLAAALPLLRHAKEVLVFTVSGAKPEKAPQAAAEAAAYLQSHAIPARSTVFDSEDRAQGRFIMETAIAFGAGLLIMGAYATLPAQEYLLGGVTLSVLNEPLLPVLMAN